MEAREDRLIEAARKYEADVIERRRVERRRRAFFGDDVSQHMSGKVLHTSSSFERDSIKPVVTLRLYFFSLMPHF
jgi:hypothetical protein